MSELQLSLMAIGALVVAAVLLYNWLQERSFRRRMQQAFGTARDDVLLRRADGESAAAGRVEPRLKPAEPALDALDETAAGPERAAAPESDTAAAFDELLDYVAEIESDSPISGPVIAELAGRIASLGKPARIAGFDARTGAWEEASPGGAGRYSRLCLSLQLASRTGAVTAAQLSAFCDAVGLAADKIHATAHCPDREAALQAARELDVFCSHVDVAVGFNVVAAGGRAFQGARIRAAAEAAGFKLEPDGVFHYRDDRRQSLFTLDNHEPAPFLPESIQGITTRGVTLLMDVPQVGSGAAVLDRMLAVAESLAAALDGHLVDDNRAALTEAGVARIKEQVRSIHESMSSHGIPAGGTRASRLFS